MSNATNDNETFAPLGLAALRVLAKIEQVKDFEARKQQQANRGDEADSEDAHRAQRAGIVGKEKRSA